MLDMVDTAFSYQRGLRILYIQGAVMLFGWREDSNLHLFLNWACLLVSVLK